MWIHLLSLELVDGAGDGSVTPAVVASATPSGVRRTRRRKYVIELDGQPIVVGSVQEARELLAAVRERVEEKARQIVQSPRAVSVAPGKAIPRVVARTQDKAVRKVVHDAQRQYDVLIHAAIAQAMAEEDELIVLLGV